MSLRPIVEPILRFYVSAMNHQWFTADNLIWFNAGCGGPDGQPVVHCGPYGDEKIAGVEAALRGMEADGLLTASMEIRCGEGHTCYGSMTRAQAATRMAADPDKGEDPPFCEECPAPETDADYDEMRAGFFVIGRYVPTPKLLAELAPAPGVVTAGMLMDALRGVRRDADVRDIPAIAALLPKNG